MGEVTEALTLTVLPERGSSSVRQVLYPQRGLPPTPRFSEARCFGKFEHAFAQSGRAPFVSLTVGGGIATLHAVASKLESAMPCVMVPGTGGCVDAIRQYLDHGMVGVEPPFDNCEDLLHKVGKNRMRADGANLLQFAELKGIHGPKELCRSKHHTSIHVHVHMHLRWCMHMSWREHVHIHDDSI